MANQAVLLTEAQDKLTTINIRNIQPFPALSEEAIELPIPASAELDGDLEYLPSYCSPLVDRA